MGFCWCFWHPDVRDLEDFRLLLRHRNLKLSKCSSDFWTWRQYLYPAVTNSGKIASTMS
ncbi:serine/threonine protein kinase [Mobiluncus mulieris]|uniref:Uncharacterized protein n=2 Tax=Mobiluncus mulieris TaxID=2052 RepID=E0QN76_9ACTO|nr:hypothetical protein HMPREF0577_1978 [Mobiluncus mulieris ATCC 35243]EFM47028.1 hypothetical protein HMPREF0580_0340 [Mobiluncus mulieris ATCC 35239]EFN94172.1 hypothetical protein HMPREF9278_0670 [Mobiluncus mulieris FB024-16]MCU9971886.1 serine/threonine protein kinase [Mobiluncus mulieris]MCU9976336.1 serine/threonine protein kinase [Mobiluncus mulieris]